MTSKLQQAGQSSPVSTAIGRLAGVTLPSLRTVAVLFAMAAPAAHAQQGLAFSNYIKSANPDPHDAFGSRVVVSGDLLAIGAYGGGRRNDLVPA